MLPFYFKSINRKKIENRKQQMMEQEAELGYSMNSPGVGSGAFKQQRGQRLQSQDGMYPQYAPNRHAQVSYYTSLMFKNYSSKTNRISVEWSELMRKEVVMLHLKL